MSSTELKQVQRKISRNVTTWNYTNSIPKCESFRTTIVIKILKLISIIGLPWTNVIISVTTGVTVLRNSLNRLRNKTSVQYWTKAYILSNHFSDNWGYCAHSIDLEIRPLDSTEQRRTFLVIISVTTGVTVLQNSLNRLRNKTSAQAQTKG